MCKLCIRAMEHPECKTLKKKEVTCKTRGVFFRKTCTVAVAAQAKGRKTIYGNHERKDNARKHARGVQICPAIDMV